MKRLLVLVVLLCLACASSNPSSKPAPSLCGSSEPVTVLVDSDNFYDVIIRDYMGGRLGMAYSHHVTQFKFCSQASTPARFMLDPIGGSMGYLLQDATDVIPGATIIMKLGSELRISFMYVVLP